MDWFSWLSKSGLEPSLVYEYALAFTRNELRGEDLIHFNHEFLQSMGISVAKHRLEILKLAKQEVGGSPKSLRRLVFAINKTKTLLTKNIRKWVFREDLATSPVSQLSPYRSRWTGALRKKSVEKMRSGPLIGRGQESIALTNESLSLSGPLDRKVHERLMPPDWSLMSSEPFARRGCPVYSGCSPNVSGPLDGLGLSPRIPCSYNKQVTTGASEAQSLWSLMFQDMKPT